MCMRFLGNVVKMEELYSSTFTTEVPEEMTLETLKEVYEILWEAEVIESWIAQEIYNIVRDEIEERQSWTVLVPESQMYSMAKGYMLRGMSLS